MRLNRFFRLEMVIGTHNHDPRTLNAPFRAARQPGLQNNKTGSIHVWTPVIDQKRFLGHLVKVQHVPYSRENHLWANPTLWNLILKF